MAGAFVDALREWDGRPRRMLSVEDAPRAVDLPVSLGEDHTHPDGYTHSPDAQDSHLLLLAILRGARLTREEKLTLRLFYIAGLPAAKVGERTGKSATAAWQFMERIHDKLRAVAQVLEREAQVRMRMTRASSPRIRDLDEKLRKYARWRAARGKEYSWRLRLLELAVEAEEFYGS